MTASIIGADATATSFCALLGRSYSFINDSLGYSFVNGATVVQGPSTVAYTITDKIVNTGNTGNT
jgi:hypothetical protein